MSKDKDNFCMKENLTEMCSLSYSKYLIRFIQFLALNSPLCSVKNCVHELRSMMYDPV